MKPGLAGILLFAFTIAQQPSCAGQNNERDPSTIASGTLNLILANKNGFVIAADSRMSSDSEFLCGTQLKLFCDNSQKLFRTSPNSALAIAGFAVEKDYSPLDLAVASVLRKRFGPKGFPTDKDAAAFPELIRNEFSEALENVAALGTPDQPLSFYATFARLSEQKMPMLRQLLFRGVLRSTGETQAGIPQFSAVVSQE
jgi:hypothetical protein